MMISERKATNILTPASLYRLHAFWRAANFLSVGQIYLRANPLLRQPLKLEHVKRMLLGHWGTTPGQNLIDAIRCWQGSSRWRRTTGA